MARAIRFMAASWATYPTVKFKGEGDLDRSLVMKRLSEAFQQDKKFTRVLLAIADAVEGGDAFRAGFFAIEALTSQQGNIFAAISPLLDKGLRAVTADDKRSRTQKIRRS